jgi:hypothetical protein
MDNRNRFLEALIKVGEAFLDIVAHDSPSSAASDPVSSPLTASVFKARLPPSAAPTHSRASTATAPTRSRVSAAASQTCTGIAPPPVLRAYAANALAAPSKQPLAQAPTRSTASTGMPPPLRASATMSPPSAASTAIPLQVMIANLLPKISTLSDCQQMRVTLIVDKMVDSMTSADLKLKGKKVSYLRKTDLFHAYFCQDTSSCLQSFLQMVEDQGLTVHRYGVQYGLKKEVSMLVEDTENAVSDVLKRLGYVKRAGDDVHYSRTKETGTDVVLLTCFKGHTYLHLYGPSSPDAQALEWKELWGCLTAPPSGEETPRKRDAAAALCFLNPGQGNDSPAARTRSRMNEEN